IKHADTTIKNHIRPDGSSYHVVDYNENTGAVIKRYTAQGYADNSTWSRGQAWGIYGFAKMYNLTTQPQYLNTSRQMAKVFLSRLPSNGVPPWDFDAPASNRPADTSAATITAEGLFILSAAETHLGNSTGAAYYNEKAVKLLTDNFKFALKPTWDSILSNGTSNNPQNNKNTGLIYGDFYALQPIVPGHVLVVPNRVVPRLSDLSPEEIADVFCTVQQVGNLVQKAYNAEGLTIACQDGPAAGQSVLDHVHVHILPRRFTDFDGNNDQVYPILEEAEGRLPAQLRAVTEKTKVPEPIKVDDEGRTPRTVEEMEKEATWLQSLFSS
ncbi:hypothetical protein FRC07_012886, partial [Ceratobasidium sp. 392]